MHTSKLTAVVGFAQAKKQTSPHKGARGCSLDLDAFVAAHGCTDNASGAADGPVTSPLVAGFKMPELLNLAKPGVFTRSCAKHQLRS